MQRAFGRPSSQIFERLSKEPIAAASLGQVYRGRLRREYGGGEIAVKVQRPGVLLSVALDLFLMRWMAVVLDRWVRACLLVHAEKAFGVSATAFHRPCEKIVNQRSSRISSAQKAFPKPTGN